MGVVFRLVEIVSVGVVSVVGHPDAYTIPKTALVLIAVALRLGRPAGRSNQQREEERQTHR